MTTTHRGTTTAPVPAQSSYQTRVADYWNAEENPVNLELGKIDNLYHHHYGVGDADWSVLDETDPGVRRERITAELHRLEHAQAELLATHLGPLSPPTGSSTPVAGAVAAASWRTCATAAPPTA